MGTNARGRQDSPMRLWYQSFAKAGRFGAYPAALERTVERARDEGTEVRIEGTTQQLGLADHHHRSIEYHDTAEVMNNALRAEAEGYDAFLIGNIADPGLFECRELVGIPVLGLCETSLHVACLMGTTYGLVTLNDKFSARVLQNVQRYRLEAQMAAVEKMQFRHLPEIAPAFSDEAQAAVLEAGFIGAATRCVERGAEVVMAAGGAIQVFLGERGVTNVAGAPVLNGSVLLVKMGELAVKMRQLTGSFGSKALTYASPGPEAIGILREACAPRVPAGASGAR